MKKPRLFLDIDGVIYAHYAGAWQIRPYTLTLINWAVEHFDVYWASWNSRKDQVALILYADPGHRTTVCVEMDEDSDIPGGSKLKWISKYGGLDDDWILIEDTAPFLAEKELLKSKNMLDRFIVIPDTGGDALLDVKIALEGWLKNRKIIVPFDWIRPMGIERDLCITAEWQGYKGDDLVPIR